MPPPQILIEIFRIERMRALERDFPSLVAHIKLRNVTFLGDLHPFLVRKFDEVPENVASALGAPVMKSVAAPLLFAVPNVQISFASQGRDRLLDQSPGLLAVLVRRI